jgi:hypothetical protein
MKAIPTVKEVSAHADDLKLARTDLKKVRTYGNAVRVQRSRKAMNTKAALIRSTFKVV